MRIAILSFWNSNDNYGQLMQCYALQQYYKSQGHEIVHIRYDFAETSPLSVKIIKLFNPKIVVRKVKAIVEGRKRKRERLKDNRGFEEFRNQYLNWTQDYHGYKELCQKPPVADMYVVGSDQVWNFYQGKFMDNRNLLHAVFLDFGDETIIRKSYAASFGGMKFDRQFINEITPLLARFSEVTVREKSGIATCELLARDDAKWVCDPTLLFNAEIYRNLYQADSSTNDMQVSQHYVFLYYLNNGGSFNIQTVYEWAGKKGLSVIYVGGNGNYDEFPKDNATIPQWLYYIDHAEYVVTNSFHCSVFSSIFGKKFGVVPITGVNEGMNERMESLFEYLQMEPRMIMNENLDVLENEIE